MGAARRRDVVGASWAAGATTRAALLEAKLRASPTVPVVLSMALGGLLPVRLAHPYLPSTRGLLRTTAPYCALVMSLVVFSTARVLIVHIPAVLEAKVFMNLYTRLKCVNAVLTITPILFIPIMWAGGRGLVARAVAFCKYELTHEALTGRRLDWSSHLRRNQVVVAVMYALLVAVFVSGKIVEPEAACHVPSYACSMHFQSHLSLWYISWISQIRFAAEDILDFLAECKEHPCATVRRARRLWVELRDTLEENRTLKNLIFLIHGYLFFVVTLSLYQVLRYCREGEMDSALAQSGINLAMFFQIFVFCNETHKCTTTMNKNFTLALDRFSLRVEEDETRKSINLFYLSIAANPCKASLAGFTNCNRPLLSAVVAATVTYLVVLIQFQTMERNSAANTSTPAVLYASNAGRAMTLYESLVYSGLSALFSVFCWFVRFAWKRWRKKKRAVKPEDGAGGDELTEEVQDIPYSICGNVMKGAGDSAIEAFAEGESRRWCCCCRPWFCCRPCCRCLS